LVEGAYSHVQKLDADDGGYCHDNREGIDRPVEQMWLDFIINMRQEPPVVRYRKDGHPYAVPRSSSPAQLASSSPSLTRQRTN